MTEFNLTAVADRLEAMEETIIFRILDRMQYKLNQSIYSIDKILLSHIKESFVPNISKGINVTEKIKEHYDSFISNACEIGDDGEYDSTAQADIEALNTISKRVHYGAFYVAESKFLSNPQKYIDTVKNDNEDAIRQLLTRREIEEKIIMRVTEKCDKIQSVYTSKLRRKIDSKLIGDFYENTVISLTKDGEIQYILRRCKNEI